MVRLSIILLLMFQIFAVFFNRGGGPLLSHLVLTGTVFATVCLCFIFKRKLNFKLSLPAALYFLFLLFFIISLFTSVTPQFGLAELLLFVNAGIVFVIFSSLEISEKDLRMLKIGLIIIAVINVLIGFFIYTKTVFPRFTGTFIDLKEPYTSFGNDFANWLMFILPLAVEQFFRRHKRFTTTLVFGLTVAILFSGFLLSFSRAAWLSLLAMAILTSGWFLAKKTQIFNVRTVLLKAAAAIILTVVLINGLQSIRSRKFETISLYEKLTFQADEGGASASERIQFWKGAVKLIKDKPYFGSGILSFKYLYPQYQEEFGVNWDHPHNLFLKIGVENGIFAAAIFALFLIATAIVILKFLWKNPQHFSLVLMLGALGSFGHNLLDYNFISSNFVLFIAFIGIAVSYAKSVPQFLTKFSAKNFYQHDLSVLFTLFIISALLLALGAYEGYYNIFFKRGRAALKNKKIDNAIILMEEAHDKLIFKRDIVHYLSDAYEKKYLDTKDKTWRQKQGGLLYVSIDKVDAEKKSKLAEIYFEDRLYNEAGIWASGALELDSRNRLKYYYQFVTALRAQGKKIDSITHDKILGLLKNYKIFLSQNRHMTVLTDNPEYASRLYVFFGMENDDKDFQQIWLKEMIKFEVRYRS